MSIRIIFSFLALMFSPFCTASLFPVVTSVKIDPSNTEYIQLIITSQLMDIGPLGDVLVKDYYTGTAGGNKGNFGIVTSIGQKSPTIAYAYGSEVDMVTGIDENMTLSEAGLYAWNHGLAGNSIIKMHSTLTHQQFSVSCVGFGFGPPPGVLSFRAAVDYPANACLQAPPPYEYCEFLNPHITQDHKTILTTAKTSQVISGMSIKCTTDISVRLLIGQDTLELAPGVISKLVFRDMKGNDYPSGSIFELTDDWRTGVNIKSTLSISPDADAGHYEASTVVYIEYP
ncbi:hypothetical protein [Cedecea davisae]|uniref:hypothetical protein n=1 Tax=Cedecea davisae TaxID=158484 RepID=UPI001D0ABB3B|nr:hypothetical protein [Cedecea davisae]